ncbi:MAG: hypothetical protein COX51_08670, partial [Syntrophobacteraceae bacterium CG23_combo_of_CG06-09_8_20_14_all_50_8]
RRSRRGNLVVKVAVTCRISGSSMIEMRTKRVAPAFPKCLSKILMLVYRGACVLHSRLIY